MLEQGVIELVNEPCAWVSPMVIVPKADGEIRICIDMRQANKVIVRERHPLPTLDDILPQLSGAKFFSKLDIKNAFHQIELSQKSRFITTFITKRGLMRYTRLIFGINNAPELFQKILERVLVGCKGSAIYLDDILVFGKSQEEHDNNLSNVLQRLTQYDVLLNEKKKEINKPLVHFMGHRISNQGVQPKLEKLDAIKKFRQPESPEECRSFLGLVTYLSRFIPHLATYADPLRKLIKDGSSLKFEWKQEHSECFNKVKTSILSASLLGYYNKEDKTKVITDASPVGLGAILIQCDKRNNERVIMFASKSLTPTERRYCQTEREALAIVWAIERFHFYLIGSKFVLFTDHKPLTYMFLPTSKPCARIERWVLRLQPYDFTVQYKQGKDNIADPFSRLSATEDNPVMFDEDAEHYVNAIYDTAAKAVTIDQVKESCKTDEFFQQLRDGLLNNHWSKSCEKWKLLAGEFSIVKEVILRGHRVYVPKALRSKVLKAGHEGHPGKEKLIQRLREKVWWPLMAKDCISESETCQLCALVAAPNKPIPMKMRQLPLGPWQDLAMDFTSSSTYGKELLVVIDYYSRFTEIKIQNTQQASETIKNLEEIFVTYGFPRTITADNGQPFASGDFKTFCDLHGIKLEHTPPLYAQANGLVERVNRDIKKRLQISRLNASDWKRDLLVDFLIMHRSTPHKTTGKTPFELMFNRKMRTKIPEMNDFSNTDDIDKEVRAKDASEKAKIKERADKTRGARKSEINVGDKVFLKNQPGDKLTPNFAPEVYTVKSRKHGDCIIISDESQVQRRRHINFLKKIPLSKGGSDNELPNPSLTPSSSTQLQESKDENSSSDQDNTINHNQPYKRKQMFDNQPTRVSARLKKQPKSLDDYIHKI